MSVEIMLSAIFCAVPAAMRVEPARTSGPVSRRTATWAVSSSGLPGDVGDADHGGAAGAGGGRGGEGVGGGAARRDADERVAGGEPGAVEVARRRGGVVLDGAGEAEERRGAAGEEHGRAGGRDAEGAGDLQRVGERHQPGATRRRRSRGGARRRACRRRAAAAASIAGSAGLDRVAARRAGLRAGGRGRPAPAGRAGPCHAGAAPRSGGCPCESPSALIMPKQYQLSSESSDGGRISPVGHLALPFWYGFGMVVAAWESAWRFISGSMEGGRAAGRRSPTRRGVCSAAARRARRTSGPIRRARAPTSSPPPGPRSAAAGGGALGDLRAVLGVAGANVPAAAARLAERLPFARARVESDALIAIKGALGDDGRHRGGDRHRLGLRRAARRAHRDDRRLGLPARRPGQRRLDGAGALRAGVARPRRPRGASPLLDAVLAEHGGPAGLVAFGAGRGSRGLRRYAPRLLEAAAAGDPAAAAILAAAEADVARAIDRLMREGPLPVCFLGGLGRVVRRTPRRALPGADPRAARQRPRRRAPARPEARMTALFSPEAFADEAAARSTCGSSGASARRSTRASSKPGQSLPPEREMASLTGLSRVTVRKAVQALVQAGRLVQRRGLGDLRRAAGREGRAGAVAPHLVLRGHGAARQGRALGLAEPRARIRPRPRRSWRSG